MESKWGGWQFDTVYGAPGYERSHIDGGSGTAIEHRYSIYANGRLVANRIATEWAGTTSFRAEYYHEDALNSVEVITDSVGRILRRFSYDAFGYRYNVTAMGFDSGALMRANNPFNTYMQKGFTSHEHLDELGLIHMNGRVYDTLMRRFLSADPHIQAPLDTQSYNRYSYVKNNPLKYTDPSGFFFKKLFKKIGNFVRNNWQVIVGTALMFLPGGQGFGAMLLKGFAANMLMSGGDWRQSALGAFTFAASGGRLNFTGESGGGADPGLMNFGIALLRNYRTYGTGPSQTTRPPDENFRTPLLYTNAKVPAGEVPAVRGGPGGVQDVTVGGTDDGPGGVKFANAGSSKAYAHALGEKQANQPDRFKVLAEGPSQLYVNAGAGGGVHIGPLGVNVSSTVARSTGGQTCALQTACLRVGLGLYGGGGGVGGGGIVFENTENLGGLSIGAGVDVGNGPAVGGTVSAGVSLNGITSINTATAHGGGGAGGSVGIDICYTHATCL